MEGWQANVAPPERKQLGSGGAQAKETAGRLTCRPLDRLLMPSTMSQHELAATFLTYENQCDPRYTLSRNQCAI